MSINPLPHLSTVALVGTVLVVGTTSGAVGGAMITSDDITPGAVTSRAVQDDSLGVGDLSPVARKALRGPRGPEGRRGPRGETGPSGADGRDGVSGLEWSWQYVAVPAGEPAEVRTSCPDGKLATGGTAWWSTSPDPVQLFIPASLTSGTAYSPGVGIADTLNVRLICAVA
jgi:hypothetical protein